MSPIRTPAGSPLVRQLLALASAALLAFVATDAAAAQTVRVVTDTSGSRIQVDGRDFMVVGVNWDYVPIGQNYAYSLWTQPDAIIRAALDREMPLLKAMGVNAIRQYVGVPPKWVRYIYEQYGIFTVLNHSMGRYGYTANGKYVANTDYSNPDARRVILGELTAVIDEFKGTPGVLMWLLGNENNYGLVWKSAETEGLPVGERDAARAKYLYSLFGEAITAIHARDTSHPVAMANGDLQYIDIIAAETKGLDVFGANVYRGKSFGDAFQRVKEKLGIPVMFTEFGADAWNARENREDQVTQAKYLLAQWREIYEQSAGKGRVGNAIGGFTFQWSDGWWKVGQETMLDVHNTDAGWSNQAYAEDWEKGVNNMNEEWWGIMAKGPADSKGLFQLYPRAAYYALQRFYQLQPYAAGTTIAAIKSAADGTDPTDALLRARADAAALGSESGKKVSIAGMRLNLSTYATGGSLLSTPSEVPSATARPSVTGFDHMESYFVDLAAHPADNVSAMLSVNALGKVADNPIDEIFYENRGRSRVVQTDGTPVRLNGIERLKIYRASVSWDERDFSMQGFYRTGHYHWGYEGDFFGLYREANYGPNIDIYNGEAPLGVEFTGKRKLAGMKVAFGPELWWGANPAVLVKYRRQLGNYDVTGIFQDDIARQGATSSSFAIPLPPTRTATFSVGRNIGIAKLEVGGIWSGSTKKGQAFQFLSGSPGDYSVLQDRIKTADEFGGKAKISVSKGRWNWYGQLASMGLVADGGPTSVQTFSGFGLKDSGLGNQNNVITGLSVNVGNFAIAPNFLWQKPLVGPMRTDAPAPARLRNFIDDPFSVRGNRETTAGELLISYDPTPGTWMYAWDNDAREDARFAANVGYTYKSFATSRDANIGFLADGRTSFVFPGATPKRDLWELRSRIVSRLPSDIRMIANLFTGTAEPNGDSQRLVRRWGGDVRLVRDQIKVMAAAKFNDWGPFDYHRDFNLTYPRQLMADVSYVLGLPKWLDVAETRMGLRSTWRTLDRLSPRYCPARVADQSGSLVCDPTASGKDGREWEIRSYLSVGW